MRKANSAPPVRTAEELATRRIGDAERTTLTLLSKADTSNPLVREWLNRLADPTCVVQFEHMAGSSGQLRDAILKRRATPAEPNESPAAAATKMRDNLIERAILVLAYALVDHREYGEPDSDHVEYVGGIAYTTSLAAAVAEYHFEIANAWAGYAERLQLAL